MKTTISWIARKAADRVVCSTCNKGMKLSSYDLDFRVILSAAMQKTIVKIDNGFHIHKR